MQRYMSKENIYIIQNRAYFPRIVNSVIAISTIIINGNKNVNMIRIDIYDVRIMPNQSCDQWCVL
eukprot:1217186-Ditylum_brightwellii.AAC.1